MKFFRQFRISFLTAILLSVPSVLRKFEHYIDTIYLEAKSLSVNIISLTLGRSTAGKLDPADLHQGTSA
jgi:hypothetical protein